MGGATTTAVTRLKKDFSKLLKDPIPYAVALPLPSNILEWHYVVTGAPDTPYEGGYYHGKLIFPSDFPFRPPSIYMITPNGRFQVNTRLCLSISDYHPDTWNPSWTVSTIITGLISFMNENSHTLGALNTTDAEKRTMAGRSLENNIRNPQFCELFPELTQSIREELNNEKSSTSNSAQSHDQSSKKHDSGSSLTATLLLVAGLAILIFTVRYVVMNASA